MRVRNVHECELPVPPGDAGGLIDSLATPHDRLWPRPAWPRMKFDRPLGVGADGGHGPIRYVVDAYVPGRRIGFRFKAPAGFDGGHLLEVVEDGTRGCVLRHVLEMSTSGRALVSWPLVFRPMHDALIEDAFAQAQASLGLTPQVRAWSPWVRVLRWLVSGGKAPPQTPPAGAPDRTAR
jgi:hypothetical protein